MTIEQIEEMRERIVMKVGLSRKWTLKTLARMIKKSSISGLKVMEYLERSIDSGFLFPDIYKMANDYLEGTEEMRLDGVFYSMVNVLSSEATREIGVTTTEAVAALRSMANLGINLVEKK